MLLKVLAFAGIVGVCASQGAFAQELRGPRELPPPGFQGQQYVDSRGCVFLRAGINGQVTWVPRVDRARRQLCGSPGSGTQVAIAPPPAAAPVAAPPAPVPAPAVAARRPLPQALGGPIDTVASLTTPPRISQTRPAPVVAVPVVAAPAARVATAGCPANAPYGERRVLPDGRSALLCGRDAGSLAAYVQRMTQAPRYAPAPAVAPVAVQVATAAPAGSDRAGYGTVPFGASGFATGGRLACPASAPVARRYALQGGGSTVICSTTSGGLAGAAQVVAAGNTYVAVQPRQVVVASAQNQPVPKGYVRAWTDDRLNPLRGVGTAEGQAQQDQVWTRTVPARLVSDTPKGKKRVVVVSASNAPKAQRKTVVTTSTSTAPKAAVTQASGRLYVQVGSFGVPSNAEGARARLAGMGLPVSGGRASIKGKPVQVVYAGPFASAAQAQAALSAARRAGFGDAFIR